MVAGFGASLPTQDFSPTSAPLLLPLVLSLRLQHRRSSNRPLAPASREPGQHEPQSLLLPVIPSEVTLLTGLTQLCLLGVPTHSLQTPLVSSADDVLCQAPSTAPRDPCPLVPEQCWLPCQVTAGLTRTLCHMPVCQDQHCLDYQTRTGLLAC